MLDRPGLGALLGTPGPLHTTEGLAITVTVLDARVSDGTLRLLVTPVAGEGTAWVARARVILTKA